MATVTQYHVVCYGSPDGYQGMRAQVALYGDARVVAYLRFHDPSMPFPTDSQAADGRITMRLPSSMLKSVIDILRNEKPIEVYFAANRGFLATSTEPIGENE